MLIVKKYNKELISLVSLQCGDTEFEDFTEKEYGQILSQAINEVTKDFSVIVRRLNFSITQETDPDWIVIPSQAFKGISVLKVNGTEYVQVKDATDAGTFDYRYDEDRKWRFTYYDKIATVDLTPVSSEPTDGVDEIEMHYTTSGEVNSEQDGTPMLPFKYMHPTAKLAGSMMARIGVTRFTGEKRQKYLDMLRMYPTKLQDGALERNDSWIVVKAPTYPGV